MKINIEIEFNNDEFNENDVLKIINEKLKNIVNYPNHFINSRYNEILHNSLLECFYKILKENNTIEDFEKIHLPVYFKEIVEKKFPNILLNEEFKKHYDIITTIDNKLTKL